MFAGHSGPVFCCSLNSKGDLAVTGGEDDKAYIWSTNSFQVVGQLDFEDSVIDVGFNCDDTLIAAIDMEGYVQVCSLSNGERVYDYDIGADINWLQWHPTLPETLMVGTQTDCTYILSLDYTTKDLRGPGADNPAGTFFRDGQKAVTGYENGTIRIWDTVISKPIYTIKPPSAHKDSVISLEVKKDDSLIASGSLDSTAKLISTQTGKVVGNLSCGINDDEKTIDTSNSVESLDFSEIHPVLATGSLNGLLEFWDINSQVKKYSFQCDQGISKIGWCPNVPYLICCAGLDGLLRIVDGRDGSLVSTKSGHEDQILDFSFAADKDCILTSSEDGTCRVFDYV
ncbi:angio-associated migratory cell protein-like [Panonychus citri]|uniref:angio-associated migratory cell protein-like n=1 Tax=Panonychus citri TaxID=50023 RepID=UPI0023072E15|nr:angio-associated migratory cell protein-like [Panonychus citri]